MAAPKTNYKRASGRAQREKHLAEVALLHMRGKQQWDIAEATDRSQGQICKDIATVEKRWLEQQTESMEKVKSRLAVTLHQLASEAWDEWQKNKDPRHFANALAAARDLRALIGADAPKKTTQEVSGSLEVRHVDELTDADLDNIAQGDFTCDAEGIPIVGGKPITLPALVA